MDKASSNFKMPKDIGDTERVDSNLNDSDHDSGDELINVGSNGGQAMSLGKQATVMDKAIEDGFKIQK